MNEVTTVPERETISVEKLLNYLEAFGLASNLTKREQAQFIEIAQAYQLNPFKREIYCVPYSTKNGRRISIITGYEVYLKRAERLGALDGWECVIEGQGDRMKAVLTIYRKNWSHPFKHEAYLEEVAKKDPATGKFMSFWATQPRFMLKKVCIAQGFRMAFPDEMGGMPYAPEELPEEMTNYQYSATEISEVDTAIIPAKTGKDPDQPNRQEQQAQPKMLAEGDLIPAWFWKLGRDEKSQFIPQGCKYAKNGDGKWAIVRMS